MARRKVFGPMALGYTLFALACGPDPGTLSELKPTVLKVEVKQDFSIRMFELCSAQIEVTNQGPASAGPFMMVLGFFNQGQQLVGGSSIDVPGGVIVGRTLKYDLLAQCAAIPFEKFKTGDTYFPGIWVNRDGKVPEGNYDNNILLKEGVVFK